MTTSEARSRTTTWLLVGVLLLAALASVNAARGAELADAVRLEARSSLEALPEQDGDSWARMRHGLAINATFNRHVSLLAAGQLFLPADGGASYTWDEATIQRIRVILGGPSLSLSLGRFVHVGSLGLIRVDGFKLDLHPEGPVGVHLWAGRIGHAEAVDLGGDLGGGVQLRLHPGALGLAAGYDLRRTPIDLMHRVHLSGSVRGKTGASLLVLAEFGFHTDNRQPAPDGPVEDPTGEDPATEETESVAGESAPHEPGLRASAHGSIPLGTRAVLRLGGRYYGLPPVTVPWSATSVIETIRPADYGVAEVVLDLRPGNGLRIRLEGGPSIGSKAVGYEDVAADAETPPEVETGVGIGAAGKAAVDYRGLGLFGTGTFVGGAWYAGGGLGAQHTVGPLGLRGEGGIYRFQGLDGSGATVGEARFQGQLDLPTRPSWGAFRVVLRAAVGTDRLLSPWWRAGVALQGSLGRAGGTL